MNLIAQIEKVDDKYAHVRVYPDSSCGASCGSCGGCSYRDGRHITIKNDNYRVGQLLDIHVNSSQALMALIVSAGIILFLLIAGYFIGSSLYSSSSETPGIVGSIVGLLIGFLIVKALEPVWQKIEYKVIPID